MQSTELPATTDGEWERRTPLPAKSQGRTVDCLFNFLPPRIVAGWVFKCRFKVSPNLTKHWGSSKRRLGPTRACPTVALRVDTGTPRGDATGSPASREAVDPCGTCSAPLKGTVLGVRRRSKVSDAMLKHCRDPLAQRGRMSGLDRDILTRCLALGARHAAEGSAGMKHQSETLCNLPKRGANVRAPSHRATNPQTGGRATGPRNGGHQPKDWTGCHFV